MGGLWDWGTISLSLRAWWLSRFIFRYDRPGRSPSSAALMLTF